MVCTKSLRLKQSAGRLELYLQEISCVHERRCEGDLNGNCVDVIFNPTCILGLEEPRTNQLGGGWFAQRA